MRHDVGVNSSLSRGALSDYERLGADCRDLLEAGFATSRSVAHYSELLGCSTRTLTRATNAVVGQAPKEMIDQRVAYAAMRLLATTELQINWIAHNLGFSQASNFSKFFRRMTGVLPAEYREAQFEESSELR